MGSVLRAGNNIRFFEDSRFNTVYFYELNGNSLERLYDFFNENKNGLYHTRLYFERDTAFSPIIHPVVVYFKITDGKLSIQMNGDDDFFAKNQKVHTEEDFINYIRKIMENCSLDTVVLNKEEFYLSKNFSSYLRIGLGYKVIRAL